MPSAVTVAERRVRYAAALSSKVLPCVGCFKSCSTTDALRLPCGCAHHDGCLRWAIFEACGADICGESGVAACGGCKSEYHFSILSRRLQLSAVTHSGCV